MVGELREAGMLSKTTVTRPGQPIGRRRAGVLSTVAIAVLPCLVLADAAAAPTDESRNATLQHLGDVALFVAGFMAEGLDRKTVGIGYYVRMGGGAYHTLSLALPANPRGRAFAPVFAELAAKFGEVVDVLNDVRHASNAGRDQDVLRLYENWLTTGSQRAGRLLRQLGIQPLKQPGSVREH